MKTETEKVRYLVNACAGRPFVKSYTIAMLIAIGISTFPWILHLPDTSANDFWRVWSIECSFAVLTATFLVWIFRKAPSLGYRIAFARVQALHNAGKHDEAWYEVIKRYRQFGVLMNSGSQYRLLLSVLFRERGYESEARVLEGSDSIIKLRDESRRLGAEQAVFKRANRSLLLVKLIMIVVIATSIIRLIMLAG